MSFVSRWFDDKRTSAEKRADNERSARDHVRAGKIVNLESTINQNSFSINNDCLDENRNTLLHLAVIYKQYGVATYLVKNGADCTKVNSFSDSSWNIALKNHDTKMIRILLRIDDVNERISNLNREIDQLRADKNNNKKRKCNECDFKTQEVKRIRKEKDTVINDLNTNIKKLRTDNADLRTTVESLRTSFQK